MRQWGLRHIHSSLVSPNAERERCGEWSAECIGDGSHAIGCWLKLFDKSFSASILINVFVYPERQRDSSGMFASVECPSNNWKGKIKV